MNLSRRGFLSRACTGAFGASILSPIMFNRQALGGLIDQNKKLIFIFQRGGNDGINTVIPRGDSEYNDTNRPTLFIPESQGLNLGNSFAQLHPALAPMMELYNKQALNGQAGPGNLAVIHRVGYADQSRSHFDSQDYWERGTPGDTESQEGMFYRHLIESKSADGSFVAASLSSSQLLGLKGDHPFPNFERINDFGFAGTAAQNTKFVGKLPTAPGSADGKGMRGLYGGKPSRPRTPYAELVHGTGKALGETLGVLRDAVGQGAYTPANGAAYPNGSFGAKLQEAALLLKRTPARILGLNIGGWDTHSGQGGANGSHANLLASIAQGFNALYKDLQDQWKDIVIVTMTEFGRTSKENGSRGTDHAEASCVFVAGGGVKGGVYNCDSTTWKTGDIFSTTSSRYLARKTDFRSIFGEIFTGHFGDDVAILDKLMPGYSAAAGKTPSDFKTLGIMG